MHQPTRWSIAYAGITRCHSFVRPLQACAAALAVTALAAWLPWAAMPLGPANF